jgi:MoxR-like ATPase
LFRAGQALAAIRGRDFVLPDDIKAVIEPVLAHRIIVNPSARLKLVSPKQIIADIVQHVPLPEVKS